MNYKELQGKLKELKLQGKTKIKLNSTKQELETEYTKVINQLEIKKMMIELDGYTTEEVLEIVDEIDTNIESYQTEVIYKNSINHILKTVFNNDYKVTVKEILKSQDQTLKEFYSKLGLKLNIDPQVLLAKMDNYLNDKYLFFQHYHDHKETIKFNLATFKKQLTITEKQKKAIGIYSDAINHVLTSVFSSNHKVTSNEILGSIHIKVSDFFGNLTSTLGIKTKAFLESLEDHLTAKYHRSESYLYNNSVIKSLVRHLSKTVEYSN